MPSASVHYCTCGHGIRAHGDCISMVVHHCPATRCAAYVQDSPQTRQCICVAPLNDHVAIVNPYRTPAVLPYMAEFFAGVHHPTNQCAAYAQQTHMMQFCTCGTQFFEHIGTYNSYHIPEPWTVLRHFNPDNNGPPLSITSSGYSNDANSPLPPKPRRPPVTAPSCFPATRWIPFTPAYIPSLSPNVNPSYPYGDTVIFTPMPQPAIQAAITQIEALSHSQVENSYGILYQDDNFSVNVQDSRVRFHQDYPYSAAQGAEAWTSQLD